MEGEVNMKVMRDFGIEDIERKGGEIPRGEREVRWGFKEGGEDREG